MKSSFSGLILALFVLHSHSSKAQQSERVDRTMHCGYVVVKAETALTDPPYSMTQILSQKITLYNTRNHSSRMLDLEQHSSANKALKGRKAVDDEAGTWFCLESNTRKRYLYLMFACQNDDTTSCRYNSERWQLYDDKGTNLHINRFNEAQAIALWKRLGLSSRQIDGKYITSDHDIFWSQ